MADEVKEGMGAKIWGFFKPVLTIALGVTVAMFIDHFATKPAIKHLESLRSEKK